MTPLEITKTYPPEIDACRTQCFSILDEMTEAANAKAAAVPRFWPEAERVRVLNKIRAELIYESQPVYSELSRLEMCAITRFSVAKEH